MPIRVFIVTGTSYRAAALAGHLRHRAAEVQVDVPDAVLGTEDLRGLADVRRVGAVELHRPDVLELVEHQHRPGGGVTLHEASAGDHLADEEAASALGRRLLQAQPAVGGVGDAGHRGQHHGRLDAQAAEGQTSVQDDFFFLLLVVGGVAGLTVPLHTIGATACSGR